MPLSCVNEIIIDQPKTSFKSRAPDMEVQKLPDQSILGIDHLQSFQENNQPQNHLPRYYQTSDAFLAIAS